MLLNQPPKLAAREIENRLIRLDFAKQSKNCPKPHFGKSAPKGLQQIQPVDLEAGIDVLQVPELVLFREVAGGFVPAEEVEFAGISTICFPDGVFGQASNGSGRSTGLRGIVACLLAGTPKCWQEAALRSANWSTSMPRLSVRDRRLL